ncbi:MAG: type II toxin-antitoxin system ParD family antitoxin [Ilumatobacteraceae bacterium]
MDNGYRNTSEYLRELIRRDQHERAARRLRDLIADGRGSGDARPVTDDVVAELRDRAFSTGA